MGQNTNLSQITMYEIEECLQQHHSFFPICHQAHDILAQAVEEGQDTDQVCVHLHFDGSMDQRQYNLPTCSEVAVILPGDGIRAKGMRDIIVRLRGGGLQWIHECHAMYMPLCYPLLFPFGEFGWFDASWWRWNS